MFKGVILVLLGACSFGILSTFVKLAYSDGYSLSDVIGTQAFFFSSILSSVELHVAVMMSSLILYEEVNFIRWIGVICILSAVVLSNLENIKKRNIFK